jgi:hypothetical protein
MYISEQRLDHFVSEYATVVQSAEPFPYVCIDNFMDEEALSQVLQFPELDRMRDERNQGRLKTNVRTHLK